jgi:hypothetical protein
MTNQHPITPPPELVEQWECEYHRSTLGPDFAFFISERAAQWGADQQLAKDVKWLDRNALNEPHLRITPNGKSLLEAMRPKPPSLKSRALKAALIELDPKGKNGSLIFQALEQLND